MTAPPEKSTNHIAHILFEPMIDLAWGQYPDLQIMPITELVSRADKRIAKESQNNSFNAQWIAPEIIELMTPQSYYPSKGSEHLGNSINMKLPETRLKLAQWYDRMLLRVNIGNGATSVKIRLPGGAIIDDNGLDIQGGLPETMEIDYNSRIDSSQNPLLLSDLIDIGVTLPRIRIMQLAHNTLHGVKITSFRFKDRWTNWDPVRERILQKYG